MSGNANGGSEGKYAPIEIVRKDGVLHIHDNPHPDLLRLLSYWKRESVVEGYRRKMKVTLEPLYIKEDEHIATYPGLLYRICKWYEKVGRTVEFIDERTPSPPYSMERALEGLYEDQKPIVRTALECGGGVISAATGFGKTVCSAGIIRAFDNAEWKLRDTPLSLFLCPSRDINRKNFLELRKLLPNRDVGICQSDHKKIFTDDVMCVTLDSVHNIDTSQVGLVICDEVHEGVSDSRTGNIISMTKALKYGVSATPSGRYDGKDLVVEALFGPVVITRTYQQAVEAGILVPIKVIWVRSPEPSVGMSRYNALSTRDGKLRNGVVNNYNRNKLLASIIDEIPDSLQTLAITPTIEHIERIAAFCEDEIVLVHAETSQKSIDKRGLKNVKVISVKERKAIYGEMASGTIRKAVSTYVYKQGVDFPGLSVVINAGGGGSEIASKQIPGRASRTTDGKDMAYLIDFWHEWDTDDGKDGPIFRDDKKRRAYYKSLGFEQVWVDDVNTIKKEIKCED